MLASIAIATTGIPANEVMMTIRSQLHSVSRAAMRGVHTNGGANGSTNAAGDASCAHVKSGLWKLLVAAAAILVVMLGAMEFFHGEAGKEFTRLAPSGTAVQTLQR
jgi:hypothetical protein